MDSKETLNISSMTDVLVDYSEKALFIVYGKSFSNNGCNLSLR